MIKNDGILDGIIRDAAKSELDARKCIIDLFDKVVGETQRETNQKRKRTDDLYDAKVKEIDDDIRRRIDELKEQGDTNE